MYSDVNAEAVTLERMKMVALQYVTTELAEHFAVEPQVSVHYEFDEVVMRFVQMVYGRTLERVEVQYPADWWEAVKERWLPEWAKELWPIRYQHHSLTAKELYPKISAPSKPHVLQLYKTDWETPTEYSDD